MNMLQSCWQLGIACVCLLMICCKFVVIDNLQIITPLLQNYELQLEMIIVQHDAEIDQDSACTSHVD